MTVFQYDLIASEETDDFTSEAVNTVAFNRDAGELFVEFHSGGQYVYEDVPESTYNLLVNSESVGKFYRDYIQARYVSDRVNVELEATEDLSPQGTVKWLTGSNPVTGQTEEEEAADEAFLAPATYGVKYTVEANGTFPSGPFEPTFEALSEADALAQFNDAVKTVSEITSLDITVQVKAVTHYFD